MFENWNESSSDKKFPSEKFINDLKVKLIEEFNFTLNKYYNYKKEFNEKTKNENNNLGKIISINPNIDMDEFNDEIMEYIEYLVEKHVLLYLPD